MNKKYGDSFKILRKHRGYVLTDFSSVGVSKSTLSDFERGESMIALDRIDAALQVMGYSLSDYDSFINHYIPTDINYLLLELEDAILQNNLEQLRGLLIISKQLNQENLSLTIELLLGVNIKSNVEILTEFLYEVINFEKVELFIFYVLMSFIPPQDVINILKKLESVIPKITSDKRYHRRVGHVLAEGIFTLTRYNRKKESKQYIEYLEHLEITETLFLTNLFNGVKGFWIYQFEDKEEGLKMITKFLKVIDLAAPSYMDEFYSNKLKKLMHLK